MTEHERTPWVSCADRMPPEGALVALRTPDGHILGYETVGGKLYRVGFSPYPLHPDSAAKCLWVALPSLSEAVG